MLRMSGVLKAAISASFLLIKKRPSAEKSDGSAIDSFGMARIDQLLGLTREGDDIVSDDADADVMKLVVGEGGHVPLIFRQGVAFIAASLGVEQIPTVLCRGIDCVLVSCDEM